MDCLQNSIYMNVQGYFNRAVRGRVGDIAMKAMLMSPHHPLLVSFYHIHSPCLHCELWCNTKSQFWHTGSDLPFMCTAVFQGPSSIMPP